jgi:hypothetical protein
MTEQHEGGNVGPEVVQDVTEASVDCPVDVEDGRLQCRRRGSIVAGVGGIREVPELMADPMRLGEDPHEEVPVLLFERLKNPNPVLKSDNRLATGAPVPFGSVTG